MNLTVTHPHSVLDFYVSTVGSKLTTNSPELAGNPFQS